jgi:alpha-tubulin suppressor-like RCC1 family protein
MMKPMRRILAPLVAASLAACAADTSSPAVADRFEVIQGGNQIGTPGWPLDSLLVVRLLDDEGRPLAGTVVAWTVSGGEGRLDSVVEVTRDDGTVSARWTLGTMSTDQRVRVLATGVPAFELSAEVAVFRASAIAVGRDGACALDLEGLPWCWSRGDREWTGKGVTTVPTRLATDQPFVSLVGGDHHWCALTATARAWCWSAWYPRATGRNPAGLPAWTPAPVEDAPDFAMLGSGQNHTCGIDPTGQAWCWGQTEDDRGLGGWPQPNSWSLVRVPQSSGTSFTRVASGWAHNCGLGTDGGVWCWGYDNWGDLGDTLLGSRNTPTRVPLPAPAHEIAAGDYHSCAILTTGPLYCWGWDFADQIEHGPDEGYARPRLTDPAPGIGLTSGWMMTHTIRHGQVARAGAMVNAAAQPVPYPELARSDPHTVPIGLFGVVQVSGQTELACARLYDGEVFCWGDVPGVGWTTTAVAVPAPRP